MAITLPGNEPTEPVIVDGETQIVEGFKDADSWIRHDLWVETEFDSDDDGKLDRMHVGITRPRQTDTEQLKVPVIYMTSPYFAGTASPVGGYLWNTEHELGEEPPQRSGPPSVKRRGERPIISNSLVKDWVPRGFAVVHSSSPGTGLSQGCPTVGGENESLAPKAVIDWLNGRASGFTSPEGMEPVEAYWSTGKVGMTGTSYNGTLALAAATTGVEGLKAIIPVAPNTSYYHYYRSNGLVRSPGGYVGEDIDVLYDFIHTQDSDRREHCDCRVRNKELAGQMDRITGDYNAFWAGRDYLHELGPLKAATLMSHGFNDWNVMPEHSVRIYEALKQKGIPVRAYYHQGGHGGPPPIRHMNRWFTRYLLDIENGVEEDPRAWIVRESADRSEPSSYDDYPHPKSSPVVLYPATADAHDLGSLSISSPRQQVAVSFVDDASISGKTLAQARSSDHRLFFATPKLRESIHLSGTPSISIKVSSSKPAANLSIWLVSLPWDQSDAAKITDNLITRGWADPQNHRSLSESEPLIPGEFYTVKFDLQPDDQIIPEGQQIGLMIFSSDRDFTLRPEPGTKLTVDLGETRLTLPIVGGEPAFQAATSP